jgi:hypothetical protein
MVSGSGPRRAKMSYHPLAPNYALIFFIYLLYEILIGSDIIHLAHLKSTHRNLRYVKIMFGWFL